MKYTSRKAELCLVLRPTDRTIDEQRRVRVIPGKRVEFMGGRYFTDDPEIIEFLHNHPMRGNKFFEINEHDEKAIEQAKSVAPKIVTGALSTGVAVGPKDEVTKIIEATPSLPDRTRPDQTVAISPELIKLIDERINAALGTIVDLLKKDTVKEEKVMSGTSTKSFKCPYCGEPFTSGFKVGSHKKECTKRPE